VEPGVTGELEDELSSPVPDRDRLDDDVLQRVELEVALKPGDVLR
jgi:hypothetical protein